MALPFGLRGGLGKPCQSHSEVEFCSFIFKLQFYFSLRRLFPGVKAAGISVASLLLAEPPEAVALGVPLSPVPISSHLPRLTAEGSQTLPLCKLHFFLIQSKSFETFHGSFSFFMSYICTSAPTLCQGTGVFNQKDCQES